MDKKKYGNILKFVICSFIGVFVFFIQININGSQKIPADHLIALLKSGISSWYLYLLLFLTGLSSVLCIIKKRYKKGASDGFFCMQNIIGFVFCLLGVLRVMPEEYQQHYDEIFQSSVNATGNILCAILLTSLFVPFLTEYGLVDFVGVFLKPFMRKFFLTPGASAVIGASAFLGNYSMGHVISKQMYDNGYFTEKESVIVAAGFSTCSIGLMINLVNYVGLMDNWTLYVLTVLIVTFGTTIIVARIPPIRFKKQEYKTGVEPFEEKPVDGKILKTAFCAGISKAERAQPIYISIKNILKSIFPILLEITGSSVFIITIGVFLNRNTNIFYWLGYLLQPFLRLTGMGAENALYCGEALSISLLEPVLAGVISEGAAMSTIAKWITAVVPYSSIIFFAGFIPSLWKSGINCKISEMLLMWVERMMIGIILTGIICQTFLWIGFI